VGGVAARPAPPVERFVGRADELRVILAACSGATQHHGSVVVVAGEAGIGKSRLCDEVARRARDAGLTVAVARCWIDGGAPALWPWQPIVTELCGAEAAELLASDTGRPTVDPDRFARFTAVTDRLAAACERAPMCLIIDDVHAADAGSLLLTRFVVRSLHRLRLTLILSRRSGEPAPDTGEAALLDGIEREAMPLVLRHFDLGETTAFLAAHGMGRLDPDLALALLRVTGGNPLFLRRIAALGPPDATRPLPDGLHAAIDQALARLSPGARQVLRTSAVLGVTPAVSDVVDVARCDPACVLEAVDEAAAAGLVAADSPDRYTFSHELVRAALEDSLGPADRLDAHARAARLVAGDDPGVGPERLARRAHHALAAAPRSTDDARQAIASCRAAARSMVRSFAYERADALLSQAIDLHERSHLGPPPDALLVEWAKAAWSCGRLAEARARFDRAVTAAERGGDPVTFAEAALGLGGHWINDHRSPVERVRVLGLQRSALADLPPEYVALRSRLAVRLAAEAVYDGAPVGPVLAALADARRCGDAEALAEALSLSHHALLTPEFAHQRLELADELIRVASEAGHGVLALMGLCWRTVDLFHLADPRAPRALEDLRERADALACQAILYIVDVLDVMLLVRSGRLDEAEARANRCFELGTAVGEVDTFSYLGAHLLTIRWIQGRDAELLDLAEEVAASPTLVEAEFAFRAAAAAIAARAGHVDRARAGLDALTAGGLAALPQSSTWHVGMLAIVETATLLGDAPVARRAYDLLQPFAALPVMPSLAVVCLGSTERPLGLAARTFGDVDRAVAHLERAVAANHRLDNRPLVAVTRAELAETLCLRDGAGDRARAADLLARAIADADAWGMDVRAAAWRADRDALVASEAVPVRQDMNEPRSDTTEEPGHRGVIRREGRGWIVALDDHRVLVVDLVGMAYLAELVSHPGQAIPALTLAGGAPAADGARQEVLDDDARAAYAARARELADDLAEAEAHADIGRAERLRAELDLLVDELESATGLGGRARLFVGPAERARTAVRKAIKRALDEIDAADPQIAAVLRASIVTGSTCTYAPDPRSPVSWSRRDN
jgi:AAA ATPase domain